ncbi:MAG: sigma-70 family RNA polymerase sigma factor [Phycisphaerae bacterium]|jgi:RNA polymerase sigma-70 factor (ECF subfamily)|nr:sigma-70 family RNA polymerase sigma factor [Phycisphaerae bacterium]
MTQPADNPSSAASGDLGEARDLAAQLYQELREIARREMSHERRDHTLQPTALVNEAFVRLVGGKEISFADRESFFAAAATTIRRILVDHARKRSRDKRGGGLVRIPLEGLEIAEAIEPFAPGELLVLDESLARLAAIDSVKSRIVELRFFAGLSVDGLVAALGISESTIRREWRLARAWLRADMESAHGESP